jgi:hypothetical protein
MYYLFDIERILCEIKSTAVYDLIYDLIYEGECKMIPNDLIVNAIIKDGLPDKGMMHENITRFVDNIDDPSLKPHVIIDAAYEMRSSDFYRPNPDFGTSPMSSVLKERCDKLFVAKCYMVTDVTITLMVEQTNSTSHQTPFCRRYYTNFSDFTPVEKSNSYVYSVDEPVYVLEQLINNLTNPVPIDIHLNLTVHDCILSAEMVHFIMKDYYYQYYTLLKPVDILFENEDHENIPKVIRTFAPNVKSHRTMLFPYVITKYLIDHDHPEYIRYLGSDIVDDLIDFCTEVDVNVVPYLIRYCERSTIQDRFKL